MQMKESLIACSENIFQYCSSCRKLKPMVDFYFRIPRSKHHTVCMVCNRSNIKKWRLKTKDKRLEYLKHNKECIKIKQKIYYNKNRNKFNINQKNYRIKNDKQCKFTRNLYMQKRRQQLDFKLLENYRRRLNKLYNTVNIKKQNKSNMLIGCTPLELKVYLCKLFIDNMTCNNYGEWEIDHIIPCTFFDINDPTELKQCFYYTNLQPLWKIDNIKKHNKVLNLNFNDLTPFI